MFQGHGIYHISHAHIAGVHISLSQGSSVDGTPVVAWSNKDDYYGHMWLVEPVQNQADTFTIRNIVTGTYMDLNGANDNTAITGKRNSGTDNQKWIIKKEVSDGSRWKIQNKATKTFVDLLYGGAANGTAIVGWQGAWDDGASAGHQHWLFDSLSMTGSEIHAAVQASPALRQDFKSYLSDGLYLILKRETITKIWTDCGVGQKTWRSELFDCDDFTTVYKAEVSKWGDATFKANGFAILCGMMFGSKPGAAHAYNWTVDTQDKTSVIFFEPQNGQFSADAWGYQAYFGLF